ncbi:hypothetical protein RAA17_18150 [Komagataeibacter rhaeticus]|nr:hypothetical protein [Komagataeibacter rhaeticus]
MHGPGAHPFPACLRAGRGWMFGVLALAYMACLLMFPREALAARVSFPASVLLVCYLACLLARCVAEPGFGRVMALGCAGLVAAHLAIVVPDLTLLARISRERDAQTRAQVARDQPVVLPASPWGRATSCFMCARTSFSSASTPTRTTCLRRAMRGPWGRHPCGRRRKLKRPFLFITVLTGPRHHPARAGSPACHWRSAHSAAGPAGSARLPCAHGGGAPCRRHSPPSPRPCHGRCPPYARPRHRPRPLHAPARLGPRRHGQGKKGGGGKGERGIPEKHGLSHPVMSGRSNGTGRAEVPRYGREGNQGAGGAAVMQAGRLPRGPGYFILSPSEKENRHGQGTDGRHPRRPDPRCRHPDGGEEGRDGKGFPDEVKKHFKTFLHTLEAGWREHEAGDHHHS